jgi:hypothetical protein
MSDDRHYGLKKFELGPVEQAAARPAAQPPVEFDEETWIDALLRETKADLGIPPEQGLCSITFTGSPDLPEHEGFRRIQKGFEVPWDLDKSGAPPWPFIGLDLGHYQATWQIWVTYAFRVGSPLAAERRWHPERGQRDLIVGLDAPHTQAQVLDAWRAFGFIQQQEEQPGIGRPKKYPSPGLYRKAIRDLIYAVPQRMARLPGSQPWQIAEWLKIGERTMYDRNSEYGITLPDIKERRV